jgi:hypothetical protein
MLMAMAMAMAILTLTWCVQRVTPVFPSPALMWFG